MINNYEEEVDNVRYVYCIMHDVYNVYKTFGSTGWGSMSLANEGDGKRKI